MVPRKLIYCLCSRKYRIKDPGKKVVFRCKKCEGRLVYECRLGEDYRLRGNRRDILLVKTIISLGSDQGNTIVIKDDVLSPHQCCFYQGIDGYEIESISDDPETLINGITIVKGERFPLHPGDLIECGYQKFRYMVPEEAVASKNTLLVPHPKNKKAISPANLRGKRLKGYETEEMEALPNDIGGAVDYMTGKSIKGYKILSVMSQGGMGKIYKARQISMGRDVVLKTIIPDIKSESSIKKRFLREIILGAKLQHPNIVSFFDSGQEEDFLFLVMEFFQGKDLNHLFRNKPIKFSRAIPIIRQVLLALQESHSQGVIHRDIKPHNVLINDQDFAKVLDFGISKAKADSSLSSITHSKDFMGSPSYMSPEQARSPKDIDERTDIYGTGATLYFCLTGRPPYKGLSVIKILQQLGKGFPKASSLAPGIPSGLDDILSKAMQKDANNRFFSTTDFLSALDSIYKT